MKIELLTKRKVNDIIECKIRNFGGEVNDLKNEITNVKIKINDIERILSNLIIKQKSHGNKENRDR